MRWLYVVSLVFLASQEAYSQKLSDLEIYRRCHAHITGQPPDIKSVEFKKIRAGEMRALAACEMLLDEALLDSNGRIDSNNLRAKQTINNFQKFHRTWFDNLSVEQISGYSEELAFGTRDIFDVTEPALELSRILFTPNAKYSEALTSQMGVFAERDLDMRIRRKIGFVEGSSEFASAGRVGNSPGWKENYFSFRKVLSSGQFVGYSANGSTSDLVQLPLIDVGEIIGIKTQTDLTMNILNTHLYPLQNDAGTGSTQPEMNYRFPLNKHFGGGIIGQPIFRMMFHGHEYGLKMDGAKKLPRRWSEAVMKTFLCAKLPALRESDIVNDLKPGSNTPFRVQTSCLMCHGTLDRMAYTARNQILVNNEFTNQTIEGVFPKLTMLMADYNATKDSVEGWPDFPVADFHLQKPTGTLYFRSFSGELVKKPVSNMQELGEKLSETDDFYQCAAKRYFEYFTGIEVLLYDRFDPKNANVNRMLTNEDVKNRLLVERLAADLKSHQSLNRLIKDILKTNHYSERNFRNRE